MTARPRKATAAATQPDFAALLGEAKMPETTVPVCMRADLVAEHKTLDRQLERLVDKPVAKLGGDGRGELKARIEELEAQMLGATYPFRLRGMARPAWRAFVAEHPPRKTDSGEVDDRDAAIGVNVETFFEAMIRRCLVDPVIDDEGWARLMDTLTDYQFNQLTDAAWALNRKEVDVPFSHAALRLNQNSEGE